MAKKKTVAKKKVSRASRSRDDGSFLIILGGGFVIISLILFFSGMLPFSVNLLNVQPNSQQTLGAETQQVVKLVTVSGNEFSPAKLLITKGTKVVFVNRDKLQVENATADNGTFDTGPLGAGDNRTVEFVKSGIYPYHNADNPQMKGVILVLE